MAQTSEDGSSGTDLQLILQAGEQAAAVLKSPVYNMAYRETVNQAFNQWLETPIQHTKEREAIYTGLTWLRKVQENMVGLVQQSEQILQQQQAQNNEYKVEEFS